MSSLGLEFRSVRYDRHRDAVIIPARFGEVAVSHSALELYASRRLTSAEAIEIVCESPSVFGRMARHVPVHEDVITITSSIVGSQSWDLPEAVDSDSEEV